MVRLPWKRPSRWGTLLLGAWLIAWGVLSLVPQVRFHGSELLLAVLALAAGVLILLER
jgi:hypothetical protein